MKVFVTGADGFIGSHLIHLLKSNNHEAIAFQGDMLDEERVQKQLAENSDIEAVVHLAGLAMGTELEPLVHANVLTTANLLKYLPPSKPKFVLASTVAVYGQPIGDKSVETDPTQPNSIYGLSKFYAEELVRTYQRINDFCAIILRFSPVYGPGNQKGVIYAFTKAIQEKGEITVNGDGTQKRNYLHVEDACNAILKSLEFSKSDVFNISSPAEVSVNDIVNLLKTKYEFTVKNQPIESTKDLLLSVDKAREVLGFEAQKKELEI